MGKEILMDFDVDGNAVISVKEVKGKACKALTKPLEEALGGQILSSEPTKEMEEKEVSRASNRAHNQRR